MCSALRSADRPQFWAADEIVTAFAEHGIVITDEAAAVLFHETNGYSMLVSAARAAHRAGVDCDDAGASIRAARLAARQDLMESLPATWTSLINYVAVAEVASLREIDLRNDGALLPLLLQRRLVATESIDGEACVAVMPALAEAVCSQLTDDDLEPIRREIAWARFRHGMVDCGLAAAFQLGDLRLCAQIMEEWSIPLSAGRFRDLSIEVLLALPTAMACDFPTVGHRLELYGKLRVGTTPVDIPTGSLEIEAASTGDRALAVMRETFYAMATRQRFDVLAAADIARRAASIVGHSMQVDGGVVSRLAPLWYLHAGISLHRLGDLSGARHFYRSGWEHRRTDEFGFVANDLASKLALLHAFDGDTSQAEVWLEEIEAVEVVPWLHERIRGWIAHSEILARHALRLDRLDLGSIRTWAERGPRQDPYDAWWAFEAWVQARYVILTGRAHLVVGIIDDCERRYASVAAGPGLHREQLAEVSAEAKLALGRGTEAAAFLGTIPAGSIHGRVSHTRLKLLSGAVSEACRLAADHRALSDTRTRDLAELALLEASAALLLDDRPRAAAAARAAVRMAMTRGDRRVFATVSREVLRDLAADVPDLHNQLAFLDEEDIAPIYPDIVHLVELSNRELIVLQSLATGETLPQIAGSLFVSKNTIKAQLRSIYAKLGVTSRQEAIAIGGRLGLIEAHPSAWK